MPVNECRIQEVTVDERRVRCRVIDAAGGAWAGATPGLPLLLLHGLGCSADVWEAALGCLGRLAADQPVWAPDMPGYGQSPGPREVLGIPELGEWAARLLDALAIPRAHVIGHSMGSQVALALARQHPARVGGLVLIGPTTGGHLIFPQRYAVGLVAGGLREPVLYGQLLVRMYREMGLRRYLASARKMMADNPFAGIDSITAPCLVVRGRHDEVVPVAAARHLAAALPRGAFLEVSAAAHVLPLDTPEPLALLALAFLAACSP